MDLHLTGKKALITGSTKGIGKAIATELAREGADVIVNGRQASVVEHVVQELTTAFPTTHPRGIAADIAQSTDQQKLFTQVPQVDILINNMGIFEPMAYQEITDDVWRKFFDVNVLAGNALAKFYLPKMLAQDFGRIIFIASSVGLSLSPVKKPSCLLVKCHNTV